MALNFPTNPYFGQQYDASNGVIYTWDGTKWNATPIPVTGNISFSNNTISTNNAGNIYIDVNGNLWDFDSTGNLILPQGGTVNWYCGGNALVGGGSGGGTWATLGDKNNACGPTNIALGRNAGFTGQCFCTVAIGTCAGNTCQGNYAVAVGTLAGVKCQGSYSTAIGTFAGQYYQGSCAVAVGCGAGAGVYLETSLVGLCGSNVTLNNTSCIIQGMAVIGNGISCGTTVIAVYPCRVIGLSSAPTCLALPGEIVEFTAGQGYAAVAVGYGAGYVLQGHQAVAVGNFAGNFTQNSCAVAIGHNAGNHNQGACAIAVGHNAGECNQPANSIMLNASGCALNGTESGLYIDPVRNCTGNVANAVYFNTFTKELTYGPSGSTGSELVNGCYTFALNSCGTVSMPCNTQLNSGGICARNAATLLFTVCRTSGPTGPITASSINMSAGNGGVGIQVVGPYAGGACGSGGPTILTFGTENISGLNGPGFAGMIASDPNITSPYSITLAGNNTIEIGFLQPCYVSTTCGYTVGVGVLNRHNSVNGLYANENKTVVSGGNAAPVSMIITDAGVNINTNSADTPLPTNLWWWNVYGDLSASLNQQAGVGAVQDAGGNVYVVGSAADMYLNPGITTIDSILLKYNPQGALVYHKRWEDTNNLPPCVYNQTIDIDANGTIWFLANNQSSSGFYVGSINPNTGSIDQQYSYGISNVVSSDMAVDAFGNQYVTGQYNSNYQVTTKVNASNGAMEWNTVSNLESLGLSVDTDPGGNVYVGGYYYDGTDYNPVVWKYNNDGEILWAQQLAGGTPSSGEVTVDHVAIHDGYLYVLIYNSDNGSTTIAKLNLNGTAAEWAIEIGFDTGTYGYDLSFDDAGYVYVTGTTYDVPADQNFYIAKLDAATGNPVWENTFGTWFASGEGHLYGARMASVNNGVIAVTGYTATNPQTGDLSSNAKVITFQLPVDNSLPPGQYGAFTLGDASYISENPIVVTPVDVTSTFSFASQSLIDNPSTLNPIAVDAIEGYSNYNYNMIPPEPVVTLTTGNAIAGGGTWTFDGRGSLTFPDGSTQFSAYEVVNIDMDGGGASTVYEVTTAYAEGGTASNKFGPNDTTFNGGNAAVTYGAGSTSINGGGA